MGYNPKLFDFKSFLFRCGVPFRVFLYYVLYVMTTIAVGTNIRTHDITDMSNFIMVLDNDKMIKLLKQDVIITIVVGSIINLLNKFSVWKGEKWENIFSTFL